MSCEQIIAELQSSDFSGVSAETAAESAAAGEELRDAFASNQARAVSLAARQGVDRGRFGGTQCGARRRGHEARS